MNLFGTNFWISFLIIAGIAMVVSYLFKIRLSMVRALFGTFFIMVGLSIVIGGLGYTGDTYSIAFNSGDIVASNDTNQYDVIFGSGTIDLSAIKPVDGVRHIKVDTIFGSSNVIVSPNTPAVIKGSSAFGSMNLPNSSNSFLGSRTYTIGDQNSPDRLEIEIDSIFSSVNVQVAG
ncbi:MAG: LiaF-related protein [Bacillota bacterium]|nr:LiaF-related protein [Bacillota bacterium]